MLQEGSPVVHLPSSGATDWHLLGNRPLQGSEHFSLVPCLALMALCHGSLSYVSLPLLLIPIRFSPLPLLIVLACTSILFPILVPFSPLRSFLLSSSSSACPYFSTCPALAFPSFSMLVLLSFPYLFVLLLWAGTTCLISCHAKCQQLLSCW